MLGIYNEGTVTKIIDFCTNHGLSRFAISAILANWYYESNFDSGNAQNSYMNALNMTDSQYTEAVDSGRWIHPRTGKDFCTDAIGYGLAQWTSSGRKTALYNYIKNHDKSIADLDSQLEFFWKELTSSGYASIYKKLMNSSDEKQSAIDFMKIYERPESVKNTSSQNARANAATEFYNKYFVNCAPKTAYLMSANTFIAKLWDITRNYKTLYVLGTWGWPATPNNKARSQKRDYNATAARKVKINNASRDTFFFDCAGLIKGILWGWCGDLNKAYGGAGYACNGVPDSGNLIGLCKDVSTNFSNITPGELVSLPGHVGVYVGDGKVIECTPKWEDCVQVSWLGNTGHTTGHYRNWEKHGKLPWIDYTTVLEEINEKTSGQELTTSEDIFTGEYISYIVQKGDNLTKIAKKFSTTVDKIVSLNNITNPSLIRVGQKLVIKGTADKTAIFINGDMTYIVQKGDTLSAIAKKFGTTVIAIQTKNKILNPNKISVGQVLKI